MQRATFKADLESFAPLILTFTNLETFSPSVTHFLAKQEQTAFTASANSR